MFCYLSIHDLFWWALNIVCELGLTFTLTHNKMKTIRVMIAIALVVDIALLFTAGCTEKEFYLYRAIWWVGAFSKSLIASYAAGQIFAWMMKYEGPIPASSIIPFFITLGITCFVRLSLPGDALMDLLMLSILPTFIMLMVGFLVRVWARYDALAAALSVCLAFMAMTAALIVRFGVQPVISRAWMAFWMMSMYFFCSSHRSMARSS
jgi:hypothetical protein